MKVKLPKIQGSVHVAAMTLACFLLASTGWLMWLYQLNQLNQLIAPVSVELLTMGLGYLMQALGVGVFVHVGGNKDPVQMRRITAQSLALFVLCLVPIAFTTDLVAVLAFGYLANLMCGFFQAFYLDCLARHVDEERRGFVFGSAYAGSTGLGWLLSAIGHGILTQGAWGLASCVVLAIPALLLVHKPVEGSAVPSADAQDTSGAHLVAFACLVAALMSLTKGAGFSFPSVDLGKGVSIETSRLLYGVGLIAAGFVCDRSRKLGALCCSCSLVMPFLMLALTGADAPATLMWALGYLFSGFFSVFRVVMLSDLAAREGTPERAGFGLLFGRVGDSAATAASSLLAGMPLVLIMVTSVLFTCTIAAFYLLYQKLYEGTTEPVLSEQERLERFGAHHDLSIRERDVLMQLIDGKSNKEIAAVLCVSESTVKFHVRNLLRKTGCSTRVEVSDLFHAGS